MPFIGDYWNVLSGQPNLYQLFLWWAIQSAKPEGRIAFLIPQSIRSGQYFLKLRQAILKNCEITAITSFVDRTGVFDTVDQQVMALALVKQVNQSPNSVEIRVSANGHTLGNLPATTLKHDQVVWAPNGYPILAISDRNTDYTILSKVYESRTVFKDMRCFRILNGGFVWNQHKERLGPEPSVTTKPLISTTSLYVHQFTFPPTDQRVAQRLYADATPSCSEPIHTGPAILLKRTTPKKLKGRRIIATMLPDSFLQQHPSYFVENHVNIVTLASDDQLLKLYGLCAWLNSKLVNFIFGMTNGSSHLSKFELELIPIPDESLLEMLGKLTMDLYTQNSIKRYQDVMKEIDTAIFESFEFTEQESTRVQAIIPSIR